MEEKFDNEQEQPQVVAIIIDSAHIADYVHASLLERGMIPTEEEAEVLGEIFFDWLIDMGMIDEIDVEEYDEEE